MPLIPFLTIFHFISVSIEHFFIHWSLHLMNYFLHREMDVSWIQELSNGIRSTFGSNVFSKDSFPSLSLSFPLCDIPNVYSLFLIIWFKDFLNGLQSRYNNLRINIREQVQVILVAESRGNSFPGIGHFTPAAICRLLCRSRRGQGGKISFHYAGWFLFNCWGALKHVILSFSNANWDDIFQKEQY